MTHIDVYYDPVTKTWHAWFEGRTPEEEALERKFYTFSHFCEVAKQYARGDSIEEEDPNL